MKLTPNRGGRGGGGHRGAAAPLKPFEDEEDGGAVQGKELPERRQCHFHVEDAIGQVLADFFDAVSCCHVDQSPPERFGGWVGVGKEWIFGIASVGDNFFDLLI